MATPAQIRDGIKAVLADIDGLTVITHPPESAPAALPAVVVSLAQASFASPMVQRGQDVWEVDALVLVSGADYQLGQAALDEFLVAAGAKSIRAAITAGRHLGLGATTTAWVDRMDDYGPRTGEQAQLVGATLRLIVRTSG
jgi:hypothetical protein